jgi:hypothetical protein
MLFLFRTRVPRRSRTPVLVERPMNRSLAATLVVVTFVCLPLAGCHVHTDKNGNNGNVDIGTPFGSMQVKTNNEADTSAIGLTAYPGALPVKDDNGKDNDAANVNMSFGSFHLGVKAASFQTADSQARVLAFYRKDLARFGDVIECKGTSTIGQPARTSQGLTCDEAGHNHISNGDSDGNDIELRAGSQQHQHIVGVETRNGGTRIGLVALDLPSHMGNHDDKSVE